MLTSGQRVAKLYVCLVETAGLGTEKHTEAPWRSPARGGWLPQHCRSRLRLGSGREPFVKMMQAAELRESYNLARTRRTGRTWLGAVLGERQVGS